MATQQCPVCNESLPCSTIEEHVNAHFEGEPPPSKKPRTESKHPHNGDNDRRRTCPNCSKFIPIEAWDKHMNVHDDEAIAVCTFFLSFFQ